MRRSGAETWSARMKRMLGLRASEQEEGGEDIEDAAETGGLWRKSISRDLAQSDSSWNYYGTCYCQEGA